MAKRRKVNDPFAKDALLPKIIFLRTYGISTEAFQKTGLQWKELEEIFRDYLKSRPDFEQAANGIVNTLLTKEAKDKGIHSVRYRVKDPLSLIEKIIRKKIENPARKITIDVYKNEITDLIGIRALHVFKNDWYNIHHFILEKWRPKKKHKPIAYYRKGDATEFINECKLSGCDTKEHPKGYRSIHYIIETSPTIQSCFAEIQIRTVFEEGWSEIDHKMRYISKKTNAHFLDKYLLVLNRIAGSADEIGSIIKNREADFQKETSPSYGAKSKKKRR